MDCLAEGRGISLPALSVAAAKGVSSTVGAYARIRKQFKVPLAEMEGVQESLAKIAGHAYIMQSAQGLTNAMLNQHEQPAVISAIMKQQMTQRMRVVVNEGMDVLGGAGICNGKANFLANAYANVPIAITVEGANILTRSLIQFGQGLTRSHPHLLHVIQAIQKGDDMSGFNASLAGVINHGFVNTGRSLALAVTRSRSRGSDPAAHYESQLLRLSANFALCSDFAMIMGGKLKSAEFISGRFADVISNLFLGYATLWHYKKHPVDGADKLVDFAMQNILADIEEAFFGVFSNFPIPMVGTVMKTLTFPTGKCYERPSDDLVRNVSNSITLDTAVRKQLEQDLFISQDDANNRVSLIVHSLPKVIQADKLLATLRKEKREPTTAEKQVIDAAEAAREEIIQVNSFPRLGKELSNGEQWSASERPAYGVKAQVQVSASAYAQA